MGRMPCSLVLAAHGSTAAENSNQPLFDLADQIKQQGVFDAVTPAFLNGDPLMENAFDGLPTGYVVIVPVMTSEGYYLRKLPEKFAANSNPDILKVLMSRVVGLHAHLPAIAAQTTRDLIREHQLAEQETTIVVVGHGTRRNKDSCLTTYDFASRLEAELNLSTVSFKTCFLDQDPSIEEVVKLVDTPNTLIVPFLISRGPHTTEDIPLAFELPSGPEVTFPLVSETENGKCVCSFPVGMMPGIANICMELASEAIQNDATIELEEVAS